MHRMAGIASRTDVRQAYLEQTPRSRALWERACESLPGGNTRTTIHQAPHPLYIVSGEGCRVTDVDGVERVDFINNYTSLILGHRHPSVVQAVQRQADRVMSVAASSELEIELAERIKERVPSIELVRFGNSGTEATMLAIRAARAFTGRDTIATFAGGYHGSHDYAASIPGEPTLPVGGPGIPDAVARTVVVAPCNDVEATRASLAPHLNDLAAVIVEPVLGAGGVVPATGEFLSFLRTLTNDVGALLVFDEVISFRVGYHGAQGKVGVAPDLTTLGKIIGGGLPVGAFGGRADVMALFDPQAPRRIPHGGTFNANPLTAAAGLATLAEMTPDRYEALDVLASDLTDRLAGVLAQSGVDAAITRAGSLFNLHLADGQLAPELHLALLNHGILLTPRGMGCLSTAITGAEVDLFAEALRRSLSDIGLG
jgi:glutamate-1-semialdehyde 2,1-aminomutase